MKKDHVKDQKQKLRRLGLNRETIRLLDDPALLGLARGGLNEGGTHSSGASCTITMTGGGSTEIC